MATHHFGPIARTDENTGAVLEVDVGSLVRRLIVFDRCTIESIGLNEIPALVAVFGAGEVMELVDSGAISIICDVMTIGEIGRPPPTLPQSVVEAHFRSGPRGSSCAE